MGQLIDRRVPTIDLPVVNLGPYLTDPGSSAALAECEKAWKAMANFGVSVVRDPRAELRHRARFLQLMQCFGAATPELQEDCRRDQTGMAIGWWPPGRETARHWPEVVEGLTEENRPFTAGFDRPPPDRKGRWHHRLWLPEWERNMADGLLATLKGEQIAPPGEQFEGWIEANDLWGRTLLSANITHAEMVALGAGVERDYFTAGIINGGTSLLAPTIVDMSKLNEWELIAGFHYDFDRFAMHGKANFGGLIVWTRDGRRVRIRVPGNCFLCQAGAEAEYMTGGAIWKGFHEVVALPREIEVARTIRSAGGSPIRVGSHCFSQGRSDVMQPHPKWRTEQTLAAYPPILASDRQAYEIRLITGQA
ncbi:MAG: hypothetical protein COW24_02180 [Candidatus Kerfeldbacteria bacterium CG15_BIG_FIL_POST_REV_8_21_14_020_45_12]|uniref:Uncharacterized protein n=1 Tax=Candidatus Kerfeldbacteria bacterium CG15_BIG_FIL_POST_REV_8_21_14_020_45_12 TaxID=2014247 RepID=A0A2M7H497_9BACT|nr:MAG: hypothetical protein COW24_02180 [Candidatus Kerfeldbacteria bacterium CG15_BIG_FIL_POST_REV_8_21_14_020_45_12]